MIPHWHLTLDRPMWLWFAILAVLPLLNRGCKRSPWPWLGAAPVDRPSIALDVGLRALAITAIVAFALATAGLASGGEAVEKISRGAHLVLLIDRSSSMNETFAGRTPDGSELSKAAAAKQLLKAFAARRQHDRVGLVAFSTAPMFVLPLTEHQEAVSAAIDAIDLPGLAYTDVARGLAMALSLFDSDDPLASRVVVLVSDGAAVIDRHVQDRLRSAITSHPMRLYWLFLRTRDGPGIFDKPDGNVADTPQEMPERHLNLYFQSLGIPYRAFEAENAEDLARAIDDIDRTETEPIRYTEREPRHDLGAVLLIFAAITTFLLLLAKLAEVRVGAAT